MTATYQAVVLAAGAASRYGGGKLLADWRGQPLIVSTVDAALRVEADEVVVVLGCDAAAVRSALSPLRCARLREVVAQDWAEGIAASLRQGVGSLPADSGGFLLMLGDMPCTAPAVGQMVLEKLKAGATAVQPFYRGRPGHPVGLSARLYADLRQLTGDVGARDMLRSRSDVVRVDVEDPGAVFDIDTPGDLTRDDH